MSKARVSHHFPKSYQFFFCGKIIVSDSLNNTFIDTQKHQPEIEECINYKVNEMITDEKF
ncbi:hypothetical protein [Chryseobacterium ginsenosidimutans]|uniref:hypothetical protein n=1 Tax=Chryseobacterium ginsenosidimutans TaxID=687846 RepID=UPI002168C269|nr:hypothetical protein [Chryseobacterium ginsenosidimutans]